MVPTRAADGLKSFFLPGDDDDCGGGSVALIDGTIVEGVDVFDGRVIGIQSKSGEIELQPFVLLRRRGHLAGDLIGLCESADDGPHGSDCGCI